MSFKTNKENNTNPLSSGHSDIKFKHYGNPVFLTGCLSQNNKILRKRRSSSVFPDFTLKILPAKKQNQIANTILTRRVSLHDCSDKNKTFRNKTLSNWKKAPNQSTQSNILQESNINLLKLEAAKLDKDCNRFSQQPLSLYQEKCDFKLLDIKIKCQPKMNKCRIMKGRPELLKNMKKQNGTRIFKRKAYRTPSQTQYSNYNSEQKIRSEYTKINQKEFQSSQAPCKKNRKQKHLKRAASQIFENMKVKTIQQTLEINYNDDKHIQNAEGNKQFEKLRNIEISSNILKQNFIQNLYSQKKSRKDIVTIDQLTEDEIQFP